MLKLPISLLVLNSLPDLYATNGFAKKVCLSKIHYLDVKLLFVCTFVH